MGREAGKQYLAPGCRTGPHQNNQGWWDRFSDCVEARDSGMNRV